MSSFASIRLKIREQMRFEEFQDGHLGSHLRYLNRTILAILNLYVAPMPPIKFGPIRIMVWEEMSFEKFQDGLHGCHLGYQNETNLAVLNLHVSPMPPTKFLVNPTYHSGADVISRFSRWPPRQPPWILERNKFSNSKSPSHPNASGLRPSLGSILLTHREQT